MSEKGNTKSSEYVMLTPKERQTQVDKLLKVWNDFILVNEPTLNKDDVFINQRSLAEVVERVSKRKFYFEVFHKLPHISEFKETALYVFWITKLKPFTVTNEASKLCASVNELYAFHMVISVFEKVRRETKPANFCYPTEAMLSDFVYGLKYQDLTKESLILYIEALAASCGLPVFSSQPIHTISKEHK